MLLCATTATIVLGLAAPVVAQVDGNLLNRARKVTTQDEVDAQKKRNEDYDDAMKKLPDQNNVKRDPWGTMRGTGTSQTDQKATPKSSQKTTRTTPQ
jgi:hypothetical protein